MNAEERVRLDEGHALDGVPGEPLVGRDAAQLLWIVNLGCIDLNQWYARCDDVDRPDYLHFDLDPVPGADFQKVLDTARLVHESLEALGMPSHPKTTGSKGVHVVDGESFTKVGFIPTGVGTHGLYPSRDGRKLYIANRGSNKIHGAERGQGSVSVLDFATQLLLVGLGTGTYCIQAGAGESVSHLAGPGGAPSPGPC